MRKLPNVGHDRYGATLSSRAGGIKEACLEEVAAQVLVKLERQMERQ